MTNERIIKISEENLGWLVTNVLIDAIHHCELRAGKELIDKEEERMLLDMRAWRKAGEIMDMKYTHFYDKKPPLKKKRPTRDEIYGYLFGQATDTMACMSDYAHDVLGESLRRMQQEARND